MQLLSLAVLKTDPAYVEYDPKGHPFEVSVSPENSAIFLMSLAQFLIAALVVNRGAPHRQVKTLNWVRWIV